MTDSDDQILSIDGCDTIPKLFRSRVQELDGAVAMREKEFGLWRATSWREYGRRVRQIGLGLMSLGLKRGDVVSVLSEGNKEWLFTDLGVICVGGVTNGVYTTDSSKQLAYLINDSQSRFLFVENEESLDKWLELKEEMPSIEHVIVYDMEGLRDFEDDRVISLDDLYALGNAFGEENSSAWDEQVEVARQEDLMILIYTSGTTGPPKGAMISHRNVMYQMIASHRFLPITEHDSQLSFLPLCHIAERSFSVFLPMSAKSVINFTESPETVPDNIREVAPTIFFAVPRVWEKFYSGFLLQLQDATKIGKIAYKWGVGVGRKRASYRLEGRPVPFATRLLFWLADRLVLRNVKTMLGLNQIRWMATGAAPISPDLITWYHSLGLEMYDLYGQTENTGIATTNHTAQLKVGTVGVAYEDSEVKISTAGEILIKGPHVFMGYLNKPEKTAETIRDGWLHTGDVGTMDNEGFFRITDRLKDIIITAGGKNITPSEIENQLKFSPYVADAVVIGDKRKFLTVLIMIDHDNVVKFAQDRGVPFSNYSSLCRAEEVQGLINQEINKVNQDFARVEQVKSFRLIEQQLMPEDDELTPTMKLKRSFVNEKYKELIDSMYLAA